MRESRHIEYKEKITNTFLKTVSAFANYGSGTIQFGIKDDGTKLGVDNPKQACLDIENRINDSIDPIPDYSLSIDEKSSVITLTVREGLHKPYLYKAKAYERSDSATVEVDRLELKRLIMEGLNLSFEELPSKKQDLTFKVLEEKLKGALRIEAVTKDTLKTLDLYRDESGFNIAAELLADVNAFPGIDMARFGESISYILDRETHEHMSILMQYDRAVALYQKYYQYEEIKSIVREKHELIPEAAFREAIANAIIHRVWDVDAHTIVYMFPDRIEISSLGGLPKGVREEDYLEGKVSIFRNRIIGNIFLRLGLIERLGTGIQRINESYRDSHRKPIYSIKPNSIKVILPVLEEQNDLPEDKRRIYSLLKGRKLPSSDIVEATGFGKTKTVYMLNELVEDGYVVKTGTGRGTKYYVE